MGNNPLSEKRTQIIRGLEKTYQKMVEFKKAKTSPIIVSRNGKVVELDPNKAAPTTSYKTE
jgi:hypothetical protein